MTDPYHHRSGPRLRIIADEGPDLSDPSQRLFRPNATRCDQCRVPATSTKLLTFDLLLGKKRAGQWTLCGPCWAWRNQPRPTDTDPLRVPDTAAYIET